jgi:hypothetical protein
MYRPSAITQVNASNRADLAPPLARLAKKRPAGPLPLKMEVNSQGSFVDVLPAAALAARPRLFAALAAAYPVTFRPGRADDGRASAELHFAPSDRLAVAPPAPADRRVLVVGDSPWFGASSELVELGDGVDRRLRRVAVTDPLDGPEPGRERDEEILALQRHRPVWTRSAGPTPVDRVASALPELGSEQSLRELLFERPLAMVAVVSLLRAVCADDLPEPPPLRAAFVFDDPNLRWRSYGYIDFSSLLAHADEHGYHAAMAMIPLDAGRQHRATVDLFRDHPARLSLVMHGNNHLSRELLRCSDERTALAGAAQAIRRATSFEARNALRMDRVMMPPHGMCSASSAAALAAVGFDALCAIHPLPWLEQAPADRPLAGWEPAEYAGGCAVIPRLPLGVAAAELALRAFLDQPLVVYGHHGDLAGGLDPLAEAAAAINRLGDVEWASLGRIAAGNAATRVEKGVLRVRPWSHRLRLPVPAGVSAVAVEAPRRDAERFVGWSLDSDPVGPFDLPAAIGSDPVVNITLKSAQAVDPAVVAAPGTSLWPLVRRTATETRDRLQPLLGSGTA